MRESDVPAGGKAGPGGDEARCVEAERDQECDRRVEERIADDQPGDERRASSHWPPRRSVMPAPPSMALRHPPPWSWGPTARHPRLCRFRLPQYVDGAPAGSMTREGQCVPPVVPLRGPRRVTARPAGPKQTPPARRSVAASSARPRTPPTTPPGTISSSTSSMQASAEAVGQSRLLKELVPQHASDQLRLRPAEQFWNHVFSNGRDEHQQRACPDSGQRQRECHRQERAPRRSAEIARGFQQCRIQPGQPRIERQHHERQVGINDADIHRRVGIEQPQRRQMAEHKGGVDPAIVLQQADPGVDAHQEAGPERQHQREQ